MRIIPHHSKEARRLKARLTLLRVVRREIHARKVQGSNPVPPSRAMRKAWDSGLWPQPASFSRLSALWTPQNQAWTEDWLRLLRRQSATVTEEWHCLRRRELTEAAERERMGAISRFYTGRELQRLLHPRAPAPHSPLLYTDIPDTVMVTGSGSDLVAFRAGLKSSLALTERHGSVCVSGISPAELGEVLRLVEREGLQAKVMGQKRLVQSATDRLCAWESDLANEAKATTRLGPSAPVARVETSCQ